MARKHNPFAEREASILQTPWGEFTIAAPNKERLAQIADLKTEAEREDVTPLQAAVLGIRSVAAGLENGDEFQTHAMAAWDAGEVTLTQIRLAAEFVGGEIRGEVAEGNA